MSLERQVVLKYAPGAAGRHFDEINALQRVRSKYVVEIYDVLSFSDVSGIQTAIVEEFVEGKSLHGTGQLPPTKEAFGRVFYQLTSGVADIHDQDVIHRDIKPDNILYD